MLWVIGTNLYISCSFNIFKADLTQTNPTLVSIGDVRDAVGLTFDGTSLYTSQMFLNKLSKIDLTPISTKRGSRDINLENIS